MKYEIKQTEKTKKQIKRKKYKKIVNTRNIYPLTSKVFFGFCFQFFSYSMVVLNSLFF